jgi:hypothetical protein
MNRFIKFIFYFAAILILFSCNKEKKLNPSWEIGIATPILKTSLNINNIVADSLLTTNSDSSLQLIYNNTIYSFNPNDAAIKIPDTTVQTSYKIGNISLANQSIQYPYSLGKFCQNLGLAGNLIISNNGGTMVINGITNQQSADESINATDFFQTATIQSGSINISIDNGFPIDISQLVFQIKNQVSGNIVSIDTFTNILAGISQSKNIDLSGKYVEGTMLGKIIDLDSPGSNGLAVPIDTSDALLVTLTTNNLIVNNATAIFPSQNIIDEDQETKYNIDGGAKLKKLKVKSGTLVLKINSTIPEKTFFNYTLPSASNGTSNGIELDEILPAAPANAASSVTRTIDLAGYTIDLTGINGTKFNTFVNHLIVSIDSTGQSFPLSQDDSVYIDYGLINIVPQYVEGYLGQQIITIGPEETNLDFFKKIKSGNLSIEDLDVTFSIENGLGAEGRINIYTLKSIRSLSNTTIQLDAPSIINQPLFISRATNNPVVSSVTNYNLNTTNSNIKTWIENIPDKISYQMDVFMNPYGNTANYTDFAYDDSRININMNAQLPLSLISNALTFEDTIDFNLGNESSLDKIKSGTFHIICDNGLPLSAQLKIILLDEFGNQSTELIHSNSNIAAAPLEFNCKSILKQRTVIDIEVDENKMKLIKQAKQAIITAVFDTNSSPDCSSYIKIYSTYQLDCKLTGNFIYYTGN